METFTYSTVDKSTWGPGPWQDEPDKLQFEDPDTGLPCLIVRSPSGALCGYVGVTEGHPFYGVDYSDLPPIDLPVRGGVTFSDFCQEGAEEHGICHRPSKGEPDRVWWLGFDFAHGGDCCPAMNAKIRYAMSHYRCGERYWTVKEVAEECRDLAAVLKALEAGV
jgi:hypothetical protein